MAAAALRIPDEQETSGQYLDMLERDILRKLSMLSEGGTVDHDRPHLHRVHPGSTTPPGANADRPQDRAPDPGWSLVEYHRHLLDCARPRGPVARLTAIAAATLDYETSVRRPPAYISPDSDQNAKDRDAAILMWEGKRSEWVAVIEHCSNSYVRHLRRKHDRSMTTGRKLEDVNVGYTTDDDGGWATEPKT